MKDVFSKIEILAYYQIIGGIIGILMMILNTYDKLSANGFFIVSLVIFFGLCSISIYSGFLLLRKKYLKGLKFSVFTQSVQILSFALVGYIFEFAIGIYLRLTFHLTNDSIIGLDFGFIKWNLSRNADVDLVEININIIAILLLLFITKSFDSIKSHEIKTLIKE